MKTGGAMLLIAVGLLALWVVVTGRLGQLQAAWSTLQSNTAPGSGGLTLGGGGGGSGTGVNVSGTGVSVSGVPGVGTVSVPFGFRPLPAPTFPIGSF